MKKSTLFFGLVLGIIVLARVAAADEKKISDYKTAQECYDAAMKIDSAGISPADQTAVWGRKFALLGQAIALDPKFTQAYIPYVQTYFEQPMGHEFTDSEELDRLTALLKKGLEYNPPNGDEFYMNLVRLEDKRWGHTKDSLRRSLAYLNQALKKYPNSPIKKDILSSIYLNHSYLGESSEGVKFLWQIVNLDENELVDKSALEDLMLYYDSIKDYSNLIKISEKFLIKFGYSENYSCYALYCGTLSSNQLDLPDKAIEFGQKYIEICSNTLKGDPTTSKKIYHYLSEAYNVIGDLELSNKFKIMSN